MTDARALYQAIIVEHDRHPRNAGPLATATHHGAVDNPLCGDEVAVHVELDGAGAIAAITCEARGCALARAAASLMTERVRGLDRAAVAALAARFAGFVRTDAVDAATDTTDLGDLTAFVGVRQFRSRQACATLPFRALAAALG